MTTLIAFCRSGYESVLSDEISHKLAQVQFGGYAQFNKGDGFLSFHIVNPSDALSAYLQQLQLIFARQLWCKLAHLTFENKQDRVGELLHTLDNVTSSTMRYSDVLVEYPDTEQGKEVAKFARKFTVPLRQALRKAGRMDKQQPTKASTKRTVLHVLMLGFDSCILGESINGVSSAELGGITRLKFPNDAPSRSTLKLDDAILTMLTEEERKGIFYPGATAVDLGACPGGWSYQLVKRGMHVEAVDNGDIDAALMTTGQVRHFAEDGFRYRPQHGHVTLLVCDMIEKPDRVAELMASWLTNGWAKHAIFNLKLPMKQRFETVSNCLASISKALAKQHPLNYRIRAKHLYHDRDEVTVCVTCAF